MLLILLFHFLSATVPAFAIPDPGCSEILIPQEKTSHFISYLNYLFESQFIKPKNLADFIYALESGRFINLIPEEHAQIKSEYLIHRGGIENYIQVTADLNESKILNWAKNKLKESQHIQISRADTEVETMDCFHKIKFNPLPSGSFQRRNGQTITIVHSFEAMETLVTQKHWVENMGENPSTFSKKDAIVLPINGKNIPLIADNPIENITWWSALVFANRLSEKKGLKPVYDLSGIEWEPGTRAENGSLKPLKHKASSEVLKIVSFDYYNTSGYRLPSFDEQEYLLRAVGKSRGDYIFENAADLPLYGWIQGNSNGKPHPVAELLPLKVNGYNFYDLNGNVSEWSTTVYTRQLIEQGISKRVVMYMTGTNMIHSGGSYFYPNDTTRAGSLNAVDPNSHYAYIGIRLFRTLNFKTE